MAIQTRCPNCDASYNLAESQRGKKVQCRKCSKAFVVGGDAAPKAPAPAAAAKSGKIRKDALQPSPAPPPRPTPPPKLKAPPVRRDRDLDDDDFEDDYEDDRDDRDDRDEPEEKAGMSGGIKVLIGVCVLLVIVLGLGATGFGIWWWMRNSGNGVPTPPVAGSGGPNAPNGGLQGGNAGVPAADEFPKDVTDGIIWINTASTPERKNKAAEWLANAPVVDAQRKTVADAMEKLALDPLTHASAIKGLAHWAGPENIPTLLTAVQSDPLWGGGLAGGEAASALIRLNADGAADAFAAHLKDFIGHAEAKQLLANFGRDKAEAAVLRYMNANEDYTRKDALDLLRGFGTKPDAMFGQAVKDLRSKEPGASRRAAEYVADQPVDPARQAEVAKALEAAMGSGDGRVAAAKALAVWATPDSVPALIAELDRKDTFGTGFDGGTFPACLDALARLQDPRGADAIAKHWKDFGGRGEKTKITNALEKMGKAAEKAVLAYVNDPDPEVSADAKRLVKELGSGGNAVLDATLADLGAQDAKQRKAACDALAAMAVVPERQKDVSAALAKLLDDDDRFGFGGNSVSSAAAKALGVWADKDGGTALLRAMIRQNNNNWKDCMKALVQLKDERVVFPLIAIAESKDVFRKDDALKALNDLGTGFIETALDNALSNPATIVSDKLSIIAHLSLDATLGTKTSVPVLQQLATADPSPQVKNAAKAAAAAINKRNP